MPTARDIALKTLLQWKGLGDPPFLPERGDVFWGELSPRDRAVAFDLLTGVLRWRGTIEAVIGACVKQPVDTLDHAVQVLLWLGTYQILFHGGTADYAAVDTTVDLAKRHTSTARAAGLINLVLRNITRLDPKTKPRGETDALSRSAFAVDFESLVYFNTPVFPNPQSAPDRHLAAVRSHPVAFVTHLRKIFGDDLAGKILLRNNVRPVVTLRVDGDAVDAPAEAGLAAHAEVPRFLVAAGGWNGLIEELVSKGTLSPQDTTAAKPVLALKEWYAKEKRAAPGRILDLCAGLGTKTIQAARAFREATVTGTDIAGDKLEKLSARAKKMKAFNIVVTPMKDVEGAFDAVLVDVPCSNTGVFAKRVQSRWRWPMLDVPALRMLQLKLLGQAAERVAAGGVIVYSTCSLDPQENEKLIYQFLQQQPGRFAVAEEKSTLPSLTSDPLLTHDGGYYCILKAT